MYSLYKTLDTLVRAFSETGRPVFFQGLSQQWRDP
jgi:hypothetical protein